MAIKSEVPNWLSTKEAAALIGVDATVLYRMRQRENTPLPFYRPGGKNIQYKESDVLAYLEACKNKR